MQEQPLRPPWRPHDSLPSSPYCPLLLGGTTARPPPTAPASDTAGSQILKAGDQGKAKLKFHGNKPTYLATL